MHFPDLPFDEPETPVSFHFEDVDIALPDEAALIAWLTDTAEIEDVPFQEVNYIFCSDAYLLQMNVDFLNHDYYTDVITFQHTEGLIHGDVFISTERVADNARSGGVSFEQELLRVMVHGVLHLAGYRDKTPEEERLMREKEDFHLKRWRA